MVEIHFDGTVVLMEPNTSVYLTAHFLASRCLSNSPETKSALCLFLASWSIAQAGFWVDLAGINKMFKTSGNSYVLGYTSWEFSMDYPAPLCEGAHRSMPCGQMRVGASLLCIGALWMAFGRSPRLSSFWGRPRPVSAVIRLSFSQKLQTWWSAHQDESIGIVLFNINSTKYFRDHSLRLSFFTHTSAL